MSKAIQVPVSLLRMFMIMSVLLSAIVVTGITSAGDDGDACVGSQCVGLLEQWVLSGENPFGFDDNCDWWGSPEFDNPPCELTPPDPLRCDDLDTVWQEFREAWFEGEISDEEYEAIWKRLSQLWNGLGCGYAWPVYVPPSNGLGVATERHSLYDLHITENRLSDMGSSLPQQ